MGGWCGELAVSSAVVVVSTEVSDLAMLHLTSSLKQQQNHIVTSMSRQYSTICCKVAQMS